VLLEGRNIRLRPVTLADADAWLAGEDEQMARMFELPRRSTRDDVVAAIGNWSAMWRTGGPVRIGWRPRGAGAASPKKRCRWPSNTRRPSGARRRCHLRRRRAERRRRHLPRVSARAVAI